MPGGLSCGKGVFRPHGRPKGFPISSIRDCRSPWLLCRSLARRFGFSPTERPQLWPLRDPSGGPAQPAASEASRPRGARGAAAPRPHSYRTALPGGRGVFRRRGARRPVARRAERRKTFPLPRPTGGRASARTPPIERERLSVCVRARSAGYCGQSPTVRLPAPAFGTPMSFRSTRRQFGTTMERSASTPVISTLR